MASERSKYLLSARALRRSMRLNLADSEFANTGKEIVYFADANVVAMFTDPGAHGAYLAPFSNWLQGNQIFGTTTLTAEFLFSGKLPGQRHPTLITLDHYEDLNSMASAIHKKGQRSAAEIEAAFDVRHDRLQLDNLVSDYNTHRIDARTFMVRSSELLPGSMIGLLQGAVAEAAQFRRLLTNDMLLRMDTMQWFDRSLLHPNPQHVANWAVSIRSASKGRSNVKAIRDARSIVQILELGKREDPRDPQRRYVFITNDPAINRAYHEYRRDEIGQGRRPAQIHLRKPMEFIPLLNLGSMSDNETDRLELFPQIESTLDRLLSGDSALQRIRRRPPANRELSTSTISFEEQIEGLRELWSQAAAHALTLNASYLAKRDKENFDSIVKVLTSGDVVNAALGEIRSVLTGLSRAHAKYSIAGIFQKFLAEGRQRAQKVSAFGARRAPLVIRPEVFSQFSGNRSINDYLDGMIAGTIEFKFDVLDIGDDGVAQLFAACVAITAENWKSAREFAERAIEISQASGNADLLNEARYCCAVAMRFTLASNADVSQARSLLGAAADYYRTKRDDFARLRTVAETSALLCVAAYTTKLVPNTELARSSDAHAAENWRDSSRLAEQADELFANAEKNQSNLYRRVGLQIASITAALSIFSAWIQPSLRGDSDNTGYREDLERLKARSDDWVGLHNRLPYTANVFVKVLSYITEEDSSERTKAGLLAEELLRELLIYEEALTDFDRAEYKFFLDTILSKLSGEAG